VAAGAAAEEEAAVAGAVEVVGDKRKEL